jgi:MFS family permease
VEQLRKIPVPKPITDVVTDLPARPILIGAALAMVAAGLDPPILEPAMPSVQSAIRQAPQLQSLLLVTAVWKVAVVLLGGILADIYRSARLFRLALLTLAAASIVAALVPGREVFLVCRFVATLSVGVIIPFAIGAVGMSYTSIKRATAIGLAYAAYGGATALAPPLALLNGADGPYTPAFVVCAIVALVAFAVTRRLIPRLPHAGRDQRRLIIGTSLWAFGITAFVAALMNLRIDPLDMLVIVVGAVAVIGGTLVARRRPSGEAGRINLRVVAVVLAVGIVLGFAQVVPLLKLPQYFKLVQDLPPLLATAAILPFGLALILAGPISGWLIARIGPRTLVAGGVIAVGAADVALAALMFPNTSYFLFIVPFVLIGAGFVIATVVRTSLIFASVPKHLPATAAALNEASVGLGSRVGTVFSTAILAQVAISTYTNTLTGLSPAEIEQRLQPLRELLFAIGLPSYPELLEMIDDATRTAYLDAALTGARVALLVPGVLAIVTGVIAYFALGRRDPMKSIWDHSDERDQQPETAAVTS